MLICSYTADSFPSGAAGAERLEVSWEGEVCFGEDGVLSGRGEKDLGTSLTRPLASFVTLGKLLTVSKPQF